MVRIIWNVFRRKQKKKQYLWACLNINLMPCENIIFFLTLAETWKQKLKIPKKNKGNLNKISLMLVLHVVYYPASSKTKCINLLTKCFHKSPKHTSTETDRQIDSRRKIRTACSFTSSSVWRWVLARMWSFWWPHKCETWLAVKIALVCIYYFKLSVKIKRAITKVKYSYYL